MGSKGPNLKSYLDKPISLHINKGRKVSGTLRGYDNFMNIVLDEAIDETPGANLAKIGMVVSYTDSSFIHLCYYLFII